MRDGPLRRSALPWGILGTLAFSCTMGVVVLTRLHANQPPLVAFAAEDFDGNFDESEIVVNLARGSVRGLESNLFGRRYRGIPYGTARRWQNPVLAEELEGELDARNFSASCMRGSSMFQEELSEDCLHLNIYTPIPTAEGVNFKMPVLVWFHGGSFTMGAGSDSHAEDIQELVMTHHMLVITINYRLGIFGFLGSERLRHGTGASVGNFGTLDQQMALRWITNNIGYFGGDPDRLGLIGWSAGAASISVHLSMPTSEGLFNRAIMMSGGFTDWAAQTMEDAEVDYNDVLSASGCNTSSACLEPGPPCPCLLALSAEQLVQVQDVTPTTWAPTIDGTHLMRHPMDALETGHVLQGIPIVIGGTMEDDLTTIGARATVEDFETVAGMPTSQEGFGFAPDQVARVLELYVDGMEAPTANGLDRWSPAYWAYRRSKADKDMNCVARRAALRWESATGARAYWYVWGAAPQERYEAPPANEDNGLEIGGCWPCPGATHGSDLTYLFERRGVHVEDSRMDLSDVYQTFFRNMIYSQDPNNWKGFFLSSAVPGSGGLSRAWPASPAGGMLFEAGSSSFDSGMKADECALWDEVA